MIAQKLQPLPKKCNADYRFSEGRGTSKWTQILKNHFVNLTQLDSHDPGQAKKQWKRDLKTAAQLMVNKLILNEAKRKKLGGNAGFKRKPTPDYNGY